MKRGHKTRLLTRCKKVKIVVIFQEQLAMLNLNLENRLDAEIGFTIWRTAPSYHIINGKRCKRPDLILLDEHTAALDPKNFINCNGD